MGHFWARAYLGGWVFCTLTSSPVLAEGEVFNRVSHLFECAEEIAAEAAFVAPSSLAIYGYDGPNAHQTEKNRRPEEQKQIQKVASIYRGLMRNDTSGLALALSHPTVNPKWQYLRQEIQLKIGTTDWNTLMAFPQTIFQASTLGRDQDDQIVLGLNIFWWEQDPNITVAEQIVFLYTRHRLLNSEHDMFEPLASQTVDYPYAWETHGADEIPLIYAAYAELAGELTRLSVYNQWSAPFWHPEMRTEQLNEKLAAYHANPYAYAKAFLDALFENYCPERHDPYNGLAEIILENPLPASWNLPRPGRLMPHLEK